MSENIKVAVRVRPFLPDEVPFGCIGVSQNQVTVANGRCFAFDTVFNTDATSDDVYVALGQPLANSFLNGFNVSTIAYGQTGAGKTFTMSALTSDVVQEIFCRLREDTASAEERHESDRGFTMRITALEVYNESVGDLLHSKGAILKNTPGVTVVVPSPSNGGGGGSGAPSPSNSLSNTSIVRSPTMHTAASRQRSTSLANGTRTQGQAGAKGQDLQLREDPKGGVYVAGLTELEVRTEEALLACIECATAGRKTASTLMNATSSRSHCVVTLTLKRRGVIARCCFVDLAGSERFKKSLGVGLDQSISASLTRAGAISNGGGATGSSGDPSQAAEGANHVLADRMREGININGGLLALGNVITALCERKGHVPYRSSKLTRLLQPMLGGNSRTAMVACISPLESSIDETLNTLKYANRAKAIKTNPHLVVATSSLMTAEEAQRVIATLRRELEDTQQQLARALSAGAGPSPAVSTSPRRLRRSASASGAPLVRTDSQVSLGAGVAGGGRGRTRTSSARLRPRPTPPSPNGFECEDTHTSTRPPVLPSSSSANTAALLRQLSELKMELAKERSVTQRLQDDLFTAEYTTMIEVEKRQLAEQRVAELEALAAAAATATEEDASSLGQSSGSAGNSPHAPPTADMTLLKQLEQERDSLQALKARREEERQRLHAALARDERGGAGDTSLSGDPAIAELATEISRKTQQIAELEQENEEAAEQLRKYARELASTASEKARLQRELAKAEEQLEKSEMARQEKERERARLQAEFKRRMRETEEKAALYRRQVLRAEQEVKMRNLNLQRAELMRRHVEQLREEAARLRASRAAEQRRGVQRAAAHGQELAQLQRQLQDAEQQVAKLQSHMQQKDAEIARVRARVGGGGSGRASTNATTSAGRTAAPPRAKHSTARPVARHTGAGGAAPPAPGPPSGPSTIDARIYEEFARMQALEGELEELTQCREALIATRDVEGPKCKAALAGFRKRLHTIEERLRSAQAMGLTEKEVAALEAERADVLAKRRPLEAYERAFSNAQEQIEAFDERIESVRETIRYHLRRTRELQRVRTDSTGAPSSSLGNRSPNSVTAPHWGPGSAEGTGDGVVALPSVRDVATAQRQRQQWLARYEGTGGAFLDAVVTPAVSASDVSEVSASTTAEGPAQRVKSGQRRYIRQLEAMVELLKREAEGLRVKLREAQ